MAEALKLLNNASGQMYTLNIDLPLTSTRVYHTVYYQLVLTNNGVCLVSGETWWISTRENDRNHDTKNKTDVTTSRRVINLYYTEENVQLIYSYQFILKCVVNFI